MNGIDAVALATGQDFRAIETSCHVWATMDNNYKSLAKYWIKDEILYGELELPLCVATKGGVTKSNPVCQHSFALLGNPDAKSLACV
jgi:degradative hydroxymethylglutaryl-CoA reductase